MELEDIWKKIKFPLWKKSEDVLIRYRFMNCESESNPLGQVVEWERY